MTSPTPYARRKRAQRFRVWKLAARVLRRDVTIRFHTNPSCGGHLLPADVFANMRKCPDALRDREGGQP